MNKTEEFLMQYISEQNLTTEKFASILGIDFIDISRVIYENDIDRACEMTFEYAGKVNDTILYEQLRSFYKQWADKDFHLLIHKALESKDRTTRLMLNSIKRLILLADDMEKIRPQMDGLKILQLVIGVETLFTLTGYDENKYKKYQLIPMFIEHCINEKDKEILNNMLSRDDSHLSIEVVSRLLSAIRNELVHEGNFWQFHFPTENSMLIALKFDESYEEYKDKSYYERVYSINITYIQFKNIIVKGYTEFIKKHARGELNFT